MDYPKCCCLRIVVIFLALSSCTLVSESIQARRKIKSEKGFDGSALAQNIPLSDSEHFPGDSKKKLLEVIGKIKAEQRAAATP